MVSRHRLAQALEPLYASVLAPERMQEFLDRILALTGSCLGGVVVEDIAHGQGSVSLVSGASSLDVAPYRAFAGDNVWVNASAHALVTGGFFDSDDWVPRSDYLRCRYYNEFLRRFDDVRQSLALCALREDDAIVMMTLCRPGRLDRYTGPQAACAREVLPHWVNAYALQRRIARLERRGAGLDDALHGLGDALYMLGHDGAVVGMNAAAERLLHPAGPLRLARGRLGAGPDCGQRFAGAVHDATSGRLHDGVAQRSQARLPLRDEEGRVVAIASLHPLPTALETPLRGAGGSAGPSGHGAAVALLFVTPVRRAPPPVLASALQELFGLTAAEAALAAALHDTGDLARAATACAITAASARSRIKLVYDKTGERGQAALARLLAAVDQALPA